MLDLTTFTEYDPLNQFSRTTTRSTVTSLTGYNNVYVRKDFGAGYIIGDYNYIFDMRMSSGSGNGDMGIWSVSDYYGWNVASHPGQQLRVLWSSPGYYLLLYNSNNNTYSYNSNKLSLNTTYYIKVYRISTTVYCKVYPTSSDRNNNTNVIYTLTKTTDSGAYRYLQVAYAMNWGVGQWTGYTENYDQPIPSYIKDDELLQLTEDYILSETGVLPDDTCSLSEEVIAGYEQVYDINNKFGFLGLILKNILNKVNSAIREIVSISNNFSSVLQLTKNIINKINWKAIALHNINNDFRMLAEFQVPGDAGFQSLGKSYIKVYINNIEQTDVDVDSISISKQLDSTHTANFILGRPYDSTKPELESEIEIKYHIWTLYTGYITSITPADSPESIQINCEDEYWKQNKTKYYFLVGHKPQDDREFYYYSIYNALHGVLDFDVDIGQFVPQTINCFGVGSSDSITNLVNECGNFSWYYDVDKSKKLWVAEQGDIVTLERQSLNKNLGLYQIISMQFKETVENLVNKFRVQLGERTIRRFNKTGGSKQYISFSYALNEINPTPAWDSQYEVLSKDSGDGYGYEYHKPEDNDKYENVFKKYTFPSIVQDTEEWSDRYEPTVEIRNPSFADWICSVKEGIITDGFSLDYEAGTITFNDAIYYYKLNSYGECDAVRAPIITVTLSKKYYYSHTASSSENPETTVSNPMLFFTSKLGDYSDTIMTNLELTSFTAQQGGYYKDPDGKTIRIPSWDDSGFAYDYAYWKLNQTCDIRINGTIDLTLDAICFYNINLSKRIMINDILDNPLNITGMTYNLSSFLVTLDLENFRYYKRTVSLPSHGE